MAGLATARRSLIRKSDLSFFATSRLTPPRAGPKGALAEAVCCTREMIAPVPERAPRECGADG